MKAEDPRQEDEALSRTLQSWKVSQPLPPRFQEQVWRRIELNEAREPAWAQLFQRIAAAIGRPSLAASYVTVLLLAGLLAGYWQVRVTRAHVDEAMGARYVQMIDPYQRSHP